MAGIIPDNQDRALRLWSSFRPIPERWGHSGKRSRGGWNGDHGSAVLFGVSFAPPGCSWFTTRKNRIRMVG